MSPRISASPRAGRSPLVFYGGIDGCRGGWIFARLSGEPFSELNISFSNGLKDLLSSLRRPRRIFADIPIGLLDSGRGERPCDKAARRMLKGRAPSVFRVPVRSSIYAADYREAAERQRLRTGVGLSLQSWHIAPKIREMDLFLRAHRRLIPKVYESHPELCFYALNGGKALRFSKKEKKGIFERYRILERLIPGIKRKISEALSLLPRKVLSLDDLLDACILSASARESCGGRLRRLPDSPPRDRYGLPMRIVYAAPRALEAL